MSPSRRHVLVALLVSGLGALAFWLTGRKAPESTASKERTPEAPPRELGSPARPPPEERAPTPEPATSTPARPETPSQPTLEELYPSPYADKPPEEERRLLELTVDHHEMMLSHAEERLEELAERADESYEAEDEYEWQLEAIREGRAQTEAFRQRLRELNRQLGDAPGWER